MNTLIVIDKHNKMKYTNQINEINRINEMLSNKFGTSYEDFMKDVEVVNNESAHIRNQITFMLYLASVEKNKNIFEIIERDLSNNKCLAKEYVIDKINQFNRIASSIKKIPLEKINASKLDTLVDRDVIEILKKKSAVSDILIGQKYIDPSSKNEFDYFYKLAPLESSKKLLEQNYSMIPVFSNSKIQCSVQKYFLDFTNKNPEFEKLSIIEKELNPPLTIFKKLHGLNMFKPSSYTIY